MSSGLRQRSRVAHRLALELAELPEIVRGYEDIKLDDVKRYRAEVVRIWARLGTLDGVPAAHAG